MEDFYSGFISIIGRPNVGKSTLMNGLVGEKIAITSNKPQTTRNRIQAVLTKDDFQGIFIDTPGIHKGKSKLDTYMQKSVETTLKEIDIILFLIEPTTKLIRYDKDVLESLKGIATPVFLVINKIDKITKEEIIPIIDAYKDLYPFKEIIPISAQKGENLEALIDMIKNNLPIGPQFFPDDYLTDQPERQIVAEIIREKALMLLQDEIPHGIAVEISSMKNRGKRNIVDIEAVIYCEKASHKGMIIGKNGDMLKNIGSKARVEMEALLGSKVYLETWVKVKDNWRDNDYLLKNFGYDSKKL